MKRRPDINAIKKMLADKEKAKEQAEKEAKEIEQRLNKQKEEALVKNEEKPVEQVKTVTKVPRFSFIRKDIGTAQTKKEPKPEIVIKSNGKEEEHNEMSYKSPIICILGHVDTGKTKLLDKIRTSSVQLNEAGGITQQIGATFFPKTYYEAYGIQSIFPGMLIIDTPGHESFTNLRNRGSSLCNIAILVIDIMHSLEPQTIESIGMLKMRKTPFVIALNKIDRIYNWKSTEGIDRFDLTRQTKDVQRMFNKSAETIIMNLKENGLNAELYYKNKDISKVINIIPTSAISGEGIVDLLDTLLGLCSKFLKNRLIFRKDSFDCTVLEVKNEEGFGGTLDVVLSNGVIDENDKICLCGFKAPIITTVRTLLTFESGKESRVKNALKSVKHVKASLGIKIVANNVDKVVCGTSIIKIKEKKKGDSNTTAKLTIDQIDEIFSNDNGIMTEEEAKAFVMAEYDSVMNSIDIEEVGVHVQASTLGSLEALLNFLKDKIPVSSVGIGSIHKKDIIMASTMLEKKKEYACMLCFDIKIDKDIEEIAKSNNVRIFSSNIIYHLLDSFMKYRDNFLTKQKQDNKPSFPCKIKILPNSVWNKRSPIVMGIQVIGILQIGCVLIREDGFILGKITSIENNKKQVERAITGEKVAVKVETDDTPRMLGRHFSEEEVFYSKLTRKDIDQLNMFYANDLSAENFVIAKEIEEVFSIL